MSPRRSAERRYQSQAAQHAEDAQRRTDEHVRPRGVAGYRLLYGVGRDRSDMRIGEAGDHECDWRSRRRLDLRSRGETEGEEQRQTEAGNDPRYQ